VYLISQLIKYEFDLEFELPVSYPVTPFEIVLPELDGKTVKMYRGGKIWSAPAKPRSAGANEGNTCLFA
jgi:hypothetical protein